MIREIEISMGGMAFVLLKKRILPLLVLTYFEVSARHFPSDLHGLTHLIFIITH